MSNYANDSWKKIPRETLCFLLDQGCFGIILLLALLFVAYLALIYVVIPGLAITAALAVIVGAIGALWGFICSFKNFIIALKTNITFKGAGASSMPTLKPNDEPAIESYFFWKGKWFPELKETCRDTWTSNQDDFKDSLRAISLNNQKARTRKLLYAYTIFLIMVACAVSLGTFIWTPILLVASFSTVALLSIAYSSFAAILWAGEMLFLKFHHLSKLCPHCHEPVSMPVYECPGCHEKHNHLIPSPRYGVFYRCCITPGCNTRIPTLRLCGKQKLAAFCSNCKQPLDQTDYSPATLAIIGGRSAGKSTILDILATRILPEVASEKNMTTTVNDEADKKLVDFFKTNVEQGSFPNATQTGSIDALCFDLKSANAPYPHRLYVYDISGESFQTTTSLQNHKFFNYVKNIIWVLDPFSLEKVRWMFSDNNKLFTANRASDSSSNDCLGTWLLSLENHFHGVPTGAVCAVAITKTDVPELIGITPGDEDAACRKFLRECDYASFINKIERTFGKENVRFFAVSALGGTASQGSPQSLTPVGVREMLEWLWTKNLIIS